MTRTKIMNFRQFSPSIAEKCEFYHTNMGIDGEIFLRNVGEELYFKRNSAPIMARAWYYIHEFWRFLTAIDSLSSLTNSFMEFL